LLKKLKRKFVYFFGRDLRFKRPLLPEKMIRKIMAMATPPPPGSDPDKVHYYSTRAHLDELDALARPGDILLRYQDGYLFDKYFVGTWQHAGLYLKKGKVIDAMGNGTYLRTLDQFGEADGIVLMRIRQLSRQQAHRALAYAFEQIGKSYSVDFNDDITEQYCSGLIVNAYKFAEVLPADYLRNKAIHPDDLLQLPRLEIIWTNRKDLLKKSMGDI
jgi:cell wall-associated NlpC family hydrolase